MFNIINAGDTESHAAFSECTGTQSSTVIINTVYASNDIIW
jgi:hypothetical protein